MAVETTKPLAGALYDPHIGMGLTLAAHERKARLWQTVKIVLVWIVLIFIISFVLLQLRFEHRGDGKKLLGVGALQGKLILTL